jgi:ferredoxin
MIESRSAVEGSPASMAVWRTASTSEESGPSSAAPSHPSPTTRSGLTVGWDPAYASLLELAEACDVPTRWSCRIGVCRTCESGLLSVAVAYAPVEPPAQGDVLFCCSQPRGDVVVDL